MKKLFILLLFAYNCYAQENYIIKVIDTNLFELNDGQKVQIYGLNIPSLNNSGAKLANEIFEWEKQALVNKIFIIEFVDTDNEIKSIKLFKETRGTKLNISAWFLAAGYGSISTENEDKRDLILYQQEAQKYGVGIWGKYSGEETTGRLTPKGKLVELNKRYERPYLPLLALSIASFTLAWDSFSTASDIQNQIDYNDKLAKASKTTIDSSELKSSKTRKTVVGVVCITAGILNALFSFQAVEIKADLQTISLSYRF